MVMRKIDMTKKKYLHKHFFGFLIVFLVLQACEDKKEISSIDPISWESRQIAIPDNWVWDKSYNLPINELFTFVNGFHLSCFDLSNK